ncbi:hypothetical protein QR680_011171 [Steinernema hermaphroditum]|uniref:Uncharacterized protein n=1 Tax=Steinernema hermaphroditum TaxID=289476 RepID=A0AA39ISS3_9BILA|nr:hypothetical protein QR680_011171 [Steinernema hermaphroditum]
MSTMERDAAQRLALQLSQDAFFIGILLLRNVLSAMAVCGMGAVLRWEKITRKYHPNVRLMLRAHFAFALGYSLGTFVSEGSDSARLLISCKNSATDKCDITLYSGLGIFIMKTPNVFFLNALGINFTFIALERLFTNIWPKFYEKKCKSNVVGWALLLLTLLLSAGKIVWHSFNYNFYKVFPVTAIHAVHKDTLEQSLAIFGIVEVFNLTIVGILYYANHATRKNLTSTLSYKYQAHKNLKPLKFLVTIAIFHSIAIIVATGVFMSSVRFIKVAYNRYEPAMNWFIIYPFTLPFIFLIKQWMDSRATTKVTGVKEGTQDDHFIMLNNLFETPQPQTMQKYHPSGK